MMLFTLQRSFATICQGLVYSAMFMIPFFNLDLLVPITVDSKPSWNTLSLVPSNPLLNNVLLMAIFIIQHSILKKPVNNLILKYFPSGMEKSFYAFSSGLLIHMLFLCWLPMTEYKLWDIQTWWLHYGTIGIAFLSYYAFLRTTFGTTVKIEDLNLYGDKPPQDAFNDKASSNFCPAAKQQRPPKVYKDGIYSYIRHPMMAFLMYTIVISPTMTAGHALWSGVMAVYIVSAVTLYEEPALIEEFGDEYKQYMKEVPGFIPDLKKLFMAY